MPTYKVNPETGKLIVHIPAGTVQGVTPEEEQVQEAKTQLFQSPALKYGRTVGAALPIALGVGGDIAGTAIGGVPGGTIGTGLGTALGSYFQQQMQSQYPLLFGEKPTPNSFAPEMGRAAVEAGINMALTPAMSGVAALPSILKQGPKTKIASKFMGTPKEGLLESVENVDRLTGKEFPTTVGDFSENPVTRIFDVLSNPVSMNRVIKEQQAQLETAFQNTIDNFALTSGNTPEAYAKYVRGELLQGLRDISTKERSLIGRLKKIAETNTVWPTAKEVKGPTYLNNSAALATKFLDDLAELHNVRGSEELLQTVEGESKNVIRALMRFTSGIRKDAQGNILTDMRGNPQTLPINFDLALRLKSAIGNEGAWKDLLPGYEESTFRQLHGALNKDIQRSISGDIEGNIPGFQKFRKEALKLYTEFNEEVTKKHALFNKGNVPQIANLLSTKGESHVGNLNAILKDPEQIGRVLGGTADREKTRKVLASEWLSQLHKSARSGGKFTESTNLSEVFNSRENKEVVRKLFTQRERKDLEHLYTVIDNSRKKLPMAGVTAWGIRLTSGALALTSPALINKIADDPLSLPTSAGLVGIGIGALTFAKMVMHNPRIARAAARIATYPPDSAEHKLATRLILTGLKGKQIQFMTPNDTVLGTGTVNSKGEIVPNRYNTDTGTYEESKSIDLSDSPFLQRYVQ